MGCSVGNRDPTSLCDWISKVKCKKSSCRTQKRRNLLVQAVLSNALSRAERELKMKQQERRQKWELFKAQQRTKDVRWDEAVCKEISTSLDEFMSRMKFVQC